jgi:DNA-binding LacI/PurR family transcriptional regulator
VAIDPKNPTPLYQQVQQDIKDRITHGFLRVGDQIQSQQELSQYYQVSLITIKKALNELVSEGVLYSRVGKGTYVASASIPLELIRHKAIGLVLSDLNSPLFSLIVQSVEKHAAETGFSLLLSNSSGLETKEDEQIRRFRQMGVSGLIIASMSRVYRATETIKSLHREKFPYVMVSYMQDSDIHYIGADHEVGAYMATRHLMRQGYSLIGYLNREKGNLLGEVRKNGYLRALAEENYSSIEVVNNVSTGKLEWDDYQSGYNAGLAFASMSDRPEAIFAYNDLLAIGFEKGVLDSGLRIPEDVAIVGFDNIERSSYAPVPLTTIMQPTQEIGALAVQRLISQIQGDVIPTRTILKPKLLIRESCGSHKTSSEGGTVAKISSNA